MRVTAVLQPSAHAELTDRLTTAFLVMLERLSPVERAVLLLRQVFDYDYDRIAEIVEKSEPNCRKILARAKARVREPRPRFAASPAHRDELVQRFFEACRNGDLAGLEKILAEDITFTGDGGGKAPALTEPISGRRPGRQRARRLLARRRRRRSTSDRQRHQPRQATAPQSRSIRIVSGAEAIMRPITASHW